MRRPPDILKREAIFTGRKVTLEVHHVRDADGRIRDGKTVCGILYWQAYRHGVRAAGKDGA